MHLLDWAQIGAQARAVFQAEGLERSELSSRGRPRSEQPQELVQARQAVFDHLVAPGQACVSMQVRPMRPDKMCAPFAEGDTGAPLTSKEEAEFMAPRPLASAGCADAPVCVGAMVASDSALGGT